MWSQDIPICFGFKNAALPVKRGDLLKYPVLIPQSQNETEPYQIISYNPVIFTYSHGLQKMHIKGNRLDTLIPYIRNACQQDIFVLDSIRIRNKQGKEFIQSVQIHLDISNDSILFQCYEDVLNKLSEKESEIFIRHDNDAIKFHYFFKA